MKHSIKGDSGSKKNNLHIYKLSSQLTILEIFRFDKEEKSFKFSLKYQNIYSRLYLFKVL